jgi:AhpD family alkylhydroperoxidase
VEQPGTSPGYSVSANNNVINIKIFSVMTNLGILTREQAPAAAQPTYDGLQKMVGFMPNLYATFAHSARALNGSIAWAETLRKGELNGQEAEAIFLAASEANNCFYCVSAHTQMGLGFGLTEAQTQELRQQTSTDPKLNAVATLARDVVESRGFPAQANIDAFFAQGYSKAALVELIGFVALNTFNNYVEHLDGTPIDWPLAQRLPASEVNA